MYALLAQQSRHRCYIWVQYVDLVCKEAKLYAVLLIEDLFVKSKFNEKQKITKQ